MEADFKTLSGCRGNELWIDTACGFINKYPNLPMEKIKSIASKLNSFSFFDETINNQNLPKLGKIVSYIHSKDSTLSSKIVDQILYHETNLYRPRNFDLCWEHMKLTNFHLMIKTYDGPYWAVRKFKTLLDSPRISNTEDFKPSRDIALKICDLEQPFDIWIKQMLTIAQKNENQIPNILMTLAAKFSPDDVLLRCDKKISCPFDEKLHPHIYNDIAALLKVCLEKKTLPQNIELSQILGKIILLAGENRQLGRELLLSFLIGEQKALNENSYEELTHYDEVLPALLLCGDNERTLKNTKLINFPRIQVGYYNDCKKFVEINCKATVETWVSLMLKKIKDVNTTNELNTILEQMWDRLNKQTSYHLKWYKLSPVGKRVFSLSLDLFQAICDVNDQLNLNSKYLVKEHRLKLYIDRMGFFFKKTEEDILLPKI